MNLNKDFLDFIELLNQHKTAYMVVGGYAVGLHGYPRYTGDLDIWIEKTEENVDRLLMVIKDFGGPLAEIDKKLLMKNATKQNPSPGISFGREPIRIEVITQIDGVLFSECTERAMTKEIAGVPLRYIHYNDLIKNKLSTGRSKDIVDIEELEKKMKDKENL
ncbi:nucleotidyl transferase AbiEii/AbiGii toxin family protein [soil metagenome]